MILPSPWVGITLICGLRCHSLGAGYNPEPAKPIIPRLGAGWGDVPLHPLDRGWVFGLVEADFGAAWEAEFCDGAPTGFFYGRKVDALFCEGSHFGFEVVAHEVELVAAGFFRRDGCGFGGWEREDEPTVAGVDVTETEDVTEEGAVGFSVCAVDDDVGAGDHGYSFRRALARIVARWERRFNGVNSTTEELGSGLSIGRRGWSSSGGRRVSWRRRRRGG